MDRQHAGTERGRHNLIAVEDRGPEPGDRRGMVAIKYDIVKAGHGPYHAAAGTCCGTGVILAAHARRDQPQVPQDWCARFH